MKKSKLFVQKIKLNVKLITLREILYKLHDEDFDDEIIYNKIKDLIKYLEDTYFPLPR